MNVTRDSDRRGRTMSNDELERRLALLSRFDASEPGNHRQNLEVRNLLHELEVSQIELEMQNRELTESRASLEDSHEKYLSLYDFAPVGYLTLDKVGTVLELNLTAADLLGSERQRMIGRLFSMKIAAKDVSKFRDHLLQCRDGRKRTSDRIRLLQADKTLRPIQLSSVGVRDRESGALTFRTAITDLTEQVRAEDERLELLERIATSRDQLSGFFMQAPTPMVILEGPEHRYVLANPPYEKMIGRQALGKTVRELFPHGEVGLFIPHLDSVYRTGRPYVGKALPLELSDENGAAIKRWIDVGYYPYRSDSGMIIGVMAVHHDVTEAVLARNQLELAREEAVNATSLKSAFLANMSHEIRTPLGAILGFTEIIQTSESKSDRDRYGDIVARNGKALTKIIDDILDLSKVEAGKLELEQIDFAVTSLTAETVALFEDVASKKGVDLKLNVHESMPTSVNSDPNRIRQILINLIGNAVKFTAKGSIAVHAEPMFEGEVLQGVGFIIRDTGIGMTKAQMEKLFTPFSQADSSMTRKFGGSGLGLVLSRRLARALGGDVTVKESSSRGSAFLATVGARSARKKTESSRAHKTNFAVGNRVSRVLLVEDSVDNQLLVEIFLSRAGIAVDFANNGAEGIEMAGLKDYDVVLMDMQMPILDGYAATEQLRKRGYRKPIVALTAHAMVEERSRILALGCDAHLSKPLDPRLLIETLSRMSANIH